MESDIFTKVEAVLKRKYYGWDGAKQFDGTSDRLERMFEEFCWSLSKISEELDRCFKAAEPDSYKELLVSGPNVVWTLCPHHLLPCELTVYIGYIPNELVLGLSKFSRIANILARRPVIQEMYSRELVDAIQAKLKPKGVGVFVVGRHGCMRARGVHQNANVTTSVLSGVIENRPESRAEFYAVVKGGNGR